jgi:hypothetical protein
MVGGAVRKSSRVLILAVMIAVITGACRRHEAPDFDNPLDPANGAVVPSTPSVLRAVSGDEQIMLTWEMSSTEGVAWYIIYRALEEESGQIFQAIDSVEPQQYEDRGVVNGMMYYYRVSGVSQIGLEGRQSAVVAAIPQDLEAVIYEVTEDTEGKVMMVGDTIHFQIVTGEPGGIAKVRFRDEGSVRLYDSGRYGDLVPHDGIYEIDYVAQLGDEVDEHAVIGMFTDDMGNEANPVTADGRITINEPPPASDFQPAKFAIGTDYITLVWDENSDWRFFSYELYRSTAPGIVEEVDSLWVASFSDKATTVFTDIGLTSGTTYYYRLFVHDTHNLATGNGEVSITTLSD